jgi:hypothetical protein
VSVNGEKVTELVLRAPAGELTVQVGKGWRRVVV